RTWTMPSGSTSSAAVSRRRGRSSVGVPSGSKFGRPTSSSGRWFAPTARPSWCWVRARPRGTQERSSISPIVEDMELSVYGRTAVRHCLFDVLDGPDNVRVAHVARGVIILVDGEDAGVLLVRIVKGLEVSRVLGDDGEAVASGEAKVNIVLFAAQPDTLVR